MATARDSLNEDTLLTSEKLKAWDTNFRVVNDINAKLRELEDDVRSLKAKKEIETPVPPPITQQETIPTDRSSQPIKLKDAIESVPVFDGHRPSVSQFLRSCERA